MAVTTAITLPDQPTIGNVVYQPLGGDGWTAPHSLFMVDVHSVGDASGGTNRATVNADPRFEMLVDFLMVQVTFATVIDFRFDIGRKNSSRALQCGETVLDPSGALSARIWSPPAIIDPADIRVSGENVDTQVIQLKAMIYNFNVRASEKTPLSILLASVRRSSALT